MASGEVGEPQADSAVSGVQGKCWRPGSAMAAALPEAWPGHSLPRDP